MQEMTPEFSRILNVAHISPNGEERDIEASLEERTALARRFDLISVSSLKAKLDLTPGDNHSVAIAGSVIAEVAQRCIVTLEPIFSVINVEVDIVCVPAPSGDRQDDLGLEDDIDVELETFSNGKIDIGELAAQYLGININPYPRKGGAVLGQAEFGAQAKIRRPFEDLAKVLEGAKNK